jgi:hypothetical protein
MLDIAVAYNKYKFLGYEFLTWLWFSIDADTRQEIPGIEKDALLQIGNRIVLERGIDDAVERITIKGDDAGLEEGRIALSKGALVTEIHLSYQKNELVWSFNLKGESLNISSLKLPETGAAERKEDLEGIILEKIYLYEPIISLVQNLYVAFLGLRLSKQWRKTTYSQMKLWLAT